MIPRRRRNARQAGGCSVARQLVGAGAAVDAVVAACEARHTQVAANLAKNGAAAADIALVTAPRTTTVTKLRAPLPSLIQRAAAAALAERPHVDDAVKRLTIRHRVVIINVRPALPPVATASGAAAFSIGIDIASRLTGQHELIVAEWGSYVESSAPPPQPLSRIHGSRCSGVGSWCCPQNSQPWQPWPCVTTACPSAMAASRELVRCSRRWLRPAS